MMQLTLHATRGTPHGASRFVLAMYAWSVKPDVLRPGIVGIRGSMVTRLRPWMIMITAPHPSLPVPGLEKGCVVNGQMTKPSNK